ncbi:MAG: YfcC family protein [Oscillospiraceae bacterium]
MEQTKERTGVIGANPPEVSASAVMMNTEQAGALCADTVMEKSDPAGALCADTPLEKKNNFLQNLKIPNSYVIIFIMIVIAALLTHIIPSGEFDRIENELGRQVVVNGSYHSVEGSPVGIFGIFSAIVAGFTQSADIIFFIVFAYGFVYTLMKNGTFDAMMGSVMRKFQNNTLLLFFVVMVIFGILGSTMGMSEETYGMFPIFIGLAIALGYDAIVGGAIVTIAVSTGFASATLNPFTVGVAQGIAEVEPYSGTGFRVICLIVFMSISISYIFAYAIKIKKDPTKSLLYGEKLTYVTSGLTKEELMNIEMTTRHKLCAGVFVGVIVLLVYGTTVKSWYIPQIATLFLMGMIVAGIIGGDSANQIAETFVEAARGMMFGALMVGMSRAILVVLQQGIIIDSVVYGLSRALEGTSGAVSGILMVLVQNLLNFFIPSGSGQAAVSMPIMAPLADLVGITRQTAVLAFQFGDGYSNMFWPTSVCMICGLMGIPVNKWYKFVTPLFGIMLVAQVVLMTIAVAIGYH